MPRHYLGLLSVVSHYLLLSTMGFQVKKIIFIFNDDMTQKYTFGAVSPFWFSTESCCLYEMKAEFVPLAFCSWCLLSENKWMPLSRQWKNQVDSTFISTKRSPHVEGSLIDNKEICWGICSFCSPRKSLSWGPESLASKASLYLLGCERTVKRSPEGELCRVWWQGKGF